MEPVEWSGGFSKSTFESAGLSANPSLDVTANVE